MKKLPTKSDVAQMDQDTEKPAKSVMKAVGKFVLSNKKKKPKAPVKPVIAEEEDSD